MQIKQFDPVIFEQLYKPTVNSHKGQNGRLLVIGGSQLFHASIFWSAQVASKIVDLVHFTSPENENNDLVRQKLKAGFWEGIVVDFGEVASYITEDDVVLIGPGMERGDITRMIVNKLLENYPQKKWVVDGGALQEVESSLLNGQMIITPHQGEWLKLMSQDARSKMQDPNKIQETITTYSKEHHNLTILLKGQKDLVCRGEEIVEVEGGNPGMTKGGTGDVLAGLTAALYCKNDSFLSAQVASFVNKKAGEGLAERAGVYFNAGDLVNEVPKTLHQLR
jgi:hydroxyethylthiazole kinase-like uncharacterized protein yjeF